MPDDDYLSFVREHRPDHDSSGQIVDQDGRVLGTHSGIEGFTIGQRRGLGIALGSPRYVVQIEPLSNTVTIGRRESLERAGLEAERFNWQGPEPSGPVPCLAQVARSAHGGSSHCASSPRKAGESPLRLAPNSNHAGTSCCHISG